MAGSVTVKDVALAAEVSVITVSRVLNHHGNVSKATQQRVLKAAAELGYLDAKGDTETLQLHRIINKTDKVGADIGFFFFKLDDLPANNPFWADILAGIEDEASKVNSKVIYRSINDLISSPELIRSTISTLGLDGILLVGPPEAEIVRLVQSAHIPVILIDTDTPEQAADAVLSDYFGGARMAVEHLLQQGHRQIAHISDPPTLDSYPVELRLLGYHFALVRAGLSFDERLLAWGVSGSSRLEGGYEACQQLLARNVPFSAIFCVNDLMAVGAMRALQEAGLRVPEDVSLVGFDDIELARHLALTTIRVNRDEMGRLAVKRLLARIADSSATPLTCILKVELVKRQSVAPPVTQ